MHVYAYPMNHFLPPITSLLPSSMPPFFPPSLSPPTAPISRGMKCKVCKTQVHHKCVNYITYCSGVMRHTCIDGQRPNNGSHAMTKSHCLLSAALVLPGWSNQLALSLAMIFITCSVRTWYSTMMY